MIEYKLRPVSLSTIETMQIDLMEKQERDGKILKPPRYETQLPNGAKQTFEHDEKSILDPSTSESDRELWNQYEKDTLEFSQALEKKLANYMFYEGVECEVSQEWKDKMAWLEVELPDNPFDLKVKFVLSEIARTPEEIKNIIMQIFKISAKGVDEQKIKAAERMFRDKEEGKE